MIKKQAVRIKNSLRVLEVFNRKKINYRVLGSLLIAALNHKPHRRLGDIDILLDQKHKLKVWDVFKRSGFELVERKKIGFSWVEANHPDYLTFTFLLIGNFCDRYFSYRLSKMIELTISSTYLEPYKYTLYGKAFIGIHPESAAEGIRISSFNPKRKVDKSILSGLVGTASKRHSILKTFRVYICRVRIPYLYLLFSRLYDIYGGLRVLFGTRYEIW